MVFLVDILDNISFLTIRSTGCLFLNGFMAGMLSVTLLFLGTMFSIAALGDCSFVTTDAEILLPEEVLGDFPDDFTALRQLGLVTFAKPNGECYW